MTPRGRARLILAGLLTFIAYMLIPRVPFVIGAVVVMLVAAFSLAAFWYEKAIGAESERFSLTFAVEGLEIDNRHLAEDLDSALLRLGEVLDEHALCPVPVEPKPAARKRAPRKTTELKVVGGNAVPAQRKGGKS